MIIFDDSLKQAKGFSMRKLTRKATKLYQIYKLDENGERIYFDVCADTTSDDIEKWAYGQSAWMSGWFYNQVDENETMILNGWIDEEVR